MFAPYCDAHHSRVLLPTSSISSIARGEHGLVVQFTCSCGTTGTWTAPQRQHMGG